MNIKKKNRIIAAIVVAIVVIAGVVMFITWDRNPPIESEEDPLQEQYYQINSYLRDNVERDFRAGISLVEQTDAVGNSYYVGKLDPELDAMLDPLVDAYNADPQNNEYISLQEVRYNLTDGIAGATAISTKDSVFTIFLRWCKEPADLVWKQDGVSDSGVEHSANDPVNQKNVTNYGFIEGRDGAVFSDCKFAWE